MAGADEGLPLRFTLPSSRRGGGESSSIDLFTREVKEKFKNWPFVWGLLSDESTTSSESDDDTQQSSSSSNNTGAEASESSEGMSSPSTESDVPLLCPKYEDDDAQDRSHYIRGRSRKYRDAEYALTIEVRRRIKDNRKRRVLTILHVRAMNDLGHYVSGFIDLRCLINRRNMGPGRKNRPLKILPDIQRDLSYYDFSDDWLVLNNTENFQHVPVPPGSMEICFRCNEDDIDLILSETGPCDGVKRTVLKDDNHITVIVYDHVVDD